MRTVYANPYFHLDHLGRLAGACPEVDIDRPGHVMPHRRHIGATFAITPGSYRPDRDGDGEHEIHHHGQPAIQSTSDLYFVFDPEEQRVEGDGDDHRRAHYYYDRIRDLEILPEVNGGRPYEALARARAKAVADWKAAYGKEPDTSAWADQYAPDHVVAELSKSFAERDAELAAEKRAKADEAKAKAEKAAADVKAAAAAEKAKAAETAAGIMKGLFPKAPGAPPSEES